MNTLALVTPENVRVRAPNEPVRVVGIDLGTTNSAIAEILMQPGGTNLPEVRCLEVEQDTQQGPYIHTLVPSVVALHDGKRLVGEGAKRLRTRLRDSDLEQNRNIFWECKNDIGVRRTYHKAPDGLNSAKTIGGCLLKFLMDAALTEDPTPVTTTVVTTPASFQAAQRQDTVQAAALAGVELLEGGLVDEPIAAFIAYLVAHGKRAFAEVSSPQRFVVFDFGGGTCDVALFQLLPAKPGRPVRIAPLTVSRYLRLGGGDIDRAIVAEVLLPQLIEQNGSNARDLDYGQKSNWVMPALLGAAESLKIGLCQEITRLKKSDLYDKERANLIRKIPNFYSCSLPDRTLRLQSPTLSAVQLEKVLEPFFDKDLPYPRETDYFRTCSIFAPLQDALERARLEPHDVDLCLMVGGSSLIPQVRETVEGFFRKARFLRFYDLEQTQTAVAQGAAWQALSLALYKQGIFCPVTSDSINIQTSGGAVELIRSGTELPYPSNKDWAQKNDLFVPKTGLTETVELRVELQDSHKNVLMERLWEIPPIVSKGDPLRLRYRMDGNQVLHLRLALMNDLDRGEFHGEIANPLTNVVNPNAQRNRILELEEQMRTEQEMTGQQQRETVKQIALLEADLGRYERALYLLSRLNSPRPDGGILHRMGIICGEVGDYEREEKFYREASLIWRRWNGSFFNLALSKRGQGKLDEAIRVIDEAISIDPDPPCWVLKATLAEKLKQPLLRDSLLDKAFGMFEPLATLSDFELVWYLTGARLARDGEREQEANEERSRREKTSAISASGDLPDTRAEIVRRQ